MNLTRKQLDHPKRTIRMQETTTTEQA